MFWWVTGAVVFVCSFCRCGGFVSLTFAARLVLVSVVVGRRGVFVSLTFVSRLDWYAFFATDVYPRSREMGRFSDARYDTL